MLIKSIRAAFAVEDTLLDGIQVAAVFITIGHHHTWIVDIAVSTRAPPILNVILVCKSLVEKFILLQEVLPQPE
jgi:hypothetical protein